MWQSLAKPPSVSSEGRWRKQERKIEKEITGPKYKAVDYTGQPKKYTETRKHSDTYETEPEALSLQHITVARDSTLYDTNKLLTKSAHI